MATQYSHSKITTYENCPLQFKLKYIDNLKERWVNIEAFMGKCVHKALEKLYTDARDGRILPLGEILAFFCETWQKEFSDNVRVVKKNRESHDYFLQAQDCLKKYYSRYLPFNGNKIIGLEEKVVLPIGHEGPDENTDRPEFELVGIIDRLESRGDGGFEIHDYKTSGHLPANDDIMQDNQLNLYQLALRKKHGENIRVKQVWHYLVFDREFSIERSDEELKFARSRLINQILTIEDATNSRKFPARTGILCQYCSYLEDCPARSGFPARRSSTNE